MKMCTAENKRNITLKRSGSLLITLIIIGCQLFAGTTGKIAGHIVDGQTGDPLAATIVIENTRMGAAADIDGDYFILNVPPGIYKLKISMMGYTSEVIEDVRVQVDLTSKIDVILYSTAIQIDRTVSVVAKREIQKDLTLVVQLYFIDGTRKSCHIIAFSRSLPYTYS